MDDLAFLTGLHQLVRPATYLEIGVGDGRRLALARRRAIGVGPTAEFDVKSGVQLYHEEPASFFARERPLEHLEGRAPQLTVIGPGEEGLRWFGDVERLMRWHGVVVLDGATPFAPGDRVVVPVAPEPPRLVVLGLRRGGPRPEPGPVYAKRLPPQLVLDSSLWRVVRNGRSRGLRRGRGLAELNQAYKRDFGRLRGFVRRLRRA